MMITFTTAAPEEKTMMTVVLKILMNQISTPFLYRMACFPSRFCLYAGKSQALFDFYLKFFTP